MNHVHLYANTSNLASTSVSCGNSLPTRFNAPHYPPQNQTQFTPYHHLPPRSSFFETYSQRKSPHPFIWSLHSLPSSQPTLSHLPPSSQPLRKPLPEQSDWPIVLHPIHGMNYMKCFKLVVWVCWRKPIVNVTHISRSRIVGPWKQGRPLQHPAFSPGKTSKHDWSHLKQHFCENVVIWKKTLAKFRKFQFKLI